MLDCLIIGGGPAGLAAATYLGRYRRAALVIDAGASRAAKIPLTHNYSGFKGIAGPDLLARLRQQAMMYGTKVQAGRVTSLRRVANGFVAGVEGREIEARFVLMATGLVDEAPVIEGDPDLGSIEAIRYCPICDGYEAMDRKVGVLGNLQDGGKKALFLRTYTRDVSLFSTDDIVRCADSDKLIDAGIAIFPNAGPIAVAGNDQLSVRLEDGTEQHVDCLYPALGCAVRSDLALALGAMGDDVGCLEVDGHQQTTVDGLYAAGDVVTDLHQLSVAIGHAAVAATRIHNRLPFNPRKRGCSADQRP